MVVFQSELDPSIEVAYIEVRAGAEQGFIRCKTAESASKLLENGVKDCRLSLLQGKIELLFLLLFHLFSQ